MTPKDWLSQFLATKGLSQPDGRPLYRYHLSKKGFNLLHHSIKTPAAHIGVATFSKQAKTAHFWNAAFVLYAAEWWRREYNGSAWSWENLFESFNADVSDLTSSQRNLIVESGLLYWRRDVRKLNGRSRYLGTIAIEGGLPLNQLNESSGWLGKVFKQIIPKYARLQHTGIDATELVTECDYIPKTFQNAQIHATLGDMIAAVVDLKKEHQLQQHANPVTYLDQHAANWRDTFPLPIDDEVSAKLLSDMIATAAKAEDSATLPIRSIRQLRDDGSLQWRLELAGFISLADLKFAEADEVPGRVEVDLISNDGKVRQLGIALKTTYREQQPALKMPKPPAPITGDAALLGYAIRFKRLSETLKEKKSALCEIQWVKQKSSPIVMKSIVLIETYCGQ